MLEWCQIHRRLRCFCDLVCSWRWWCRTTVQSLPPAPYRAHATHTHTCISSSPARRTWCRSTAGFSIHFIATRLLQLTVVSSAMVNCSASAAYHECSGWSHHELVVARSREHVKPALKQQRITYKLCLFMHQIPNGQAPQCLSDCVSRVSAASHAQIPAEVVWLSGLRSA